MFAAGAFMIILGLGMTGKVPWAARLTPRPPKFLITALSNLRRKAKDDASQGESTLATPVAFGLLTGLMPCAPLQGAQIAAAATGSAVLGATAMLAFGLGTMPLMLAFGTASSFIPKDWKHRLSILLAVIVMVFGLVFINRAAMLVGSPVTFNSVRSAVLGGPSTTSSSSASFTTGADGVVEVPMAIIDTEYVPATVDPSCRKPVRAAARPAGGRGVSTASCSRSSDRRRARTQCRDHHRHPRHGRGYLLHDVRHGHDVGQLRSVGNGACAVR